MRWEREPRDRSIRVSECRSLSHPHPLPRFTTVTHYDHSLRISRESGVNEVVRREWWGKDNSFIDFLFPQRMNCLSLPHHQPLTTFTSDDERYDNVEGFPRLILHLGTHLTFGSDHSEWSEARAEGTWEEPRPLVREWRAAPTSLSSSLHSVNGSETSGAGMGRVSFTPLSLRSTVVHCDPPRSARYTRFAHRMRDKGPSWA